MKKGSLCSLFSLYDEPGLAHCTVLAPRFDFSVCSFKASTQKTQAFLVQFHLCNLYQKKMTHKGSFSFGTGDRTLNLGFAQSFAVSFAYRSAKPEEFAMQILENPVGEPIRSKERRAKALRSFDGTGDRTCPLHRTCPAL